MALGVIVYIIVALACVGLLIVRRYSAFFGRGELGGLFKPKAITAIILFSLWLLYLVVVALRVYDIIPPI